MVPKDFELPEVQPPWVYEKGRTYIIAMIVIMILIVIALIFLGYWIYHKRNATKLA